MSSDKVRLIRSVGLAKLSDLVVYRHLILRAPITFALIMEVVNTSETSDSFYETTRRNIPEDSHLHIRRRENLKCHSD
jgi:hypothetical protein